MSNINYFNKLKQIGRGNLEAWMRSVEGSLAKIVQEGIDNIKIPDLLEDGVPNSTYTVAGQNFHTLVDYNFYHAVDCYAGPVAGLEQQSAYMFVICDREVTEFSKVMQYAISEVNGKHYVRHGLLSELTANNLPWVDLAGNASSSGSFYQFIDYNPKINFWWTSEDPVRLRKADGSQFRTGRSDSGNPPAVLTNNYSFFGTSSPEFCSYAEISYLSLKHKVLPDRIAQSDLNIKRHFFYYVPKTEYTRYTAPNSALDTAVRSVCFLVAMPSVLDDNTTQGFTNLKPPAHLLFEIASSTTPGSPFTITAEDTFFTSLQSTAGTAKVTASFATFNDLLKLMPLGQVSMVYAEVIGGSPNLLRPDDYYPVEIDPSIGVIDVFVNGVKLTQDTPELSAYVRTVTGHNQPHPGLGNWLNAPTYANILHFVPTPGSTGAYPESRPHIVFSAECNDLLTSEEQLEILNKFNAEYYKI